MLNPESIDALTFDVFGTVVDWRGSIVRDCQPLSTTGNPSIDWAEFADRWRALYQPAMARVRRGEQPWTNLDSLHRSNLDQLLDEFELTGLDDTERDHLNRVWHRLDPWPDSVEGLTRLKRRYILATMSNGNVALIVNMAKRAGLPWDVVLGAEVVRRYKPLPEPYLRSAALLDRPPERCLMVAAHNSDLVAAAGCGFRTAFVCRPTEYGPHQTIDLEPTADYDIVADDMIDLARQLDC